MALGQRWAADLTCSSRASTINRSFGEVWSLADASSLAEHSVCFGTEASAFGKRPKLDPRLNTATRDASDGHRVPRHWHHYTLSNFHRFEPPNIESNIWNLGFKTLGTPGNHHREHPETARKTRNHLLYLWESDASVCGPLFHLRISILFTNPTKSYYNNCTIGFAFFSLFSFSSRHNDPRWNFDIKN